MKDLVLVVLVNRLSIRGILVKAACGLLPHRTRGFLPHLMTYENITSKFKAKAISPKMTAGYSNRPYHCLNCSSFEFFYQLQKLNFTNIKLEKSIFLHEELTLLIFSRERVRSVRNFVNTTTPPLPT